MESFLIFLLIGAVSSFIAGLLWKGKGFGIVGNIIVGIIGGFLGGWLADTLGLDFRGIIGQIIVSVGGAWILLFLINLLKKK
jgi:uncharacterized membrane protein YeaQ/YmgE (transglycosylase-associated protein family)